MTLQEAEAKYGHIDQEYKVWPDQNKWMTLLKLPSDLVFENWKVIGTSSPVIHLYCNIDLVDPLLKALQNLKNRNLQGELKTFDGLFNIRFVRGSEDSPSTHCYGLAIDINAAENPLGGPVNLSKEFVQCFKDAGFSWGGDFKRVDAMHFSKAWE